MRKALYLILVLSLFSYCQTERSKVERVMEDGVLHIKNPESPLKGTIALELEKIREIDPYQYEEVGMSLVFPERDETGEVILFDPQKAEAHHFSPEGDYLDNFIRIGQGPGEFQEYHGTHPHFMDGKILVTSSIKMAWFTKEGEFISERKLAQYLDTFIDGNRYLSHRTEWNDTGRLVKVFIVELTEERTEQEGPVFFEGENVGMFYDMQKKRGFSDLWATPNFYYVYNPVTEKIFGGLNSDYKIFVKDLDGKTEAVIEKPYQPVRFSAEQKKEASRWKPDDEFAKWKLSVYPDTQLAIRAMKILPNGFLAVYRFSGFKEYEVDIFNLEREYLYALKVPQDIALERAQVCTFGFATVENRDDMPVYVEYRVKNLPALFKSKNFPFP